MKVDAVEICRSPSERIGGWMIAALVAACVVGTASSSQYLGSVFFFVLGLGAWLVVIQGDKKNLRNNVYWLKADELGLQGGVII